MASATRSHARDITLNRLDIAVELRGAVAETTVTAAFTSTARETLEGDFKLQLAGGRGGHRLCARYRRPDDRRRAGRSAQAPRRCTRTASAATSIPAVADVTADNVFSTRIFPIAPDRGRDDPGPFRHADRRDGRCVCRSSIAAPAKAGRSACTPTDHEAPSVTLPERRRAVRCCRRTAVRQGGGKWSARRST